MGLLAAVSPETTQRLLGGKAGHLAADRACGFGPALSCPALCRICRRPPALRSERFDRRQPHRRPEHPNVGGRLCRGQGRRHARGGR
ncbi:hypothetical protein SAM23877_7390 [Streptomyces ambofaciens ATCC 23877]|uniref:Uncharacterized protein n=1 Tax=Streptomyces ambofaciens (strain ATCC 23877 / 3486 / DSM 40053 / JCM 4204 / NBRC 12836 / NRRL B-2516) TaxID=278992 RepID=A0A0K2B5K6_STRA7|nr:hypothetical protein SAM23877_7390 [Streptomyces ambofaciens ATCC 23877]